MTARQYQRDMSGMHPHFNQRRKPRLSGSKRAQFMATVGSSYDSLQRLPKPAQQPRRSYNPAHGNNALGRRQH